MAEQELLHQAVLARLQELLRVDPSLGYRTLHERLKADPQFSAVSLKKVQSALQQLRETATQSNASMEAQQVPQKGQAGPGENIWTAASDGDSSRVESLIALEGYQPSSADENGYTPVHAAASYGHVDLLRRLLSMEPAAANVADSDGDAPLHHVAEATDLEEEQVKEVVELLLTHRADPRQQNSEGKTCLEACASALAEENGEAMEDEEDAEVSINLPFLRVMAANGIQLEAESS
mmetsp:Transcript_23754/g.55357  ORF Transcript_23754/g.55357 Transcript_23754/m.55357 type:complete len:236 (+) Transcript_23754:66-773(+)